VGYREFTIAENERGRGHSQDRKKDEQANRATKIKGSLKENCEDIMKENWERLRSRRKGEHAN